MDVAQAIKERSSCRIYQDRPVDKELITELVGLAARAPSALNLQPWLFTAVMGEELKRLAKKLTRALAEMGLNCAPETDGGEPKALPQRYLDRQQELFAVMGPAIKATESPWDNFTNQGSLNFYGAPAAIIICGEAALAHQARFDLGLATGFLMLAARERGLACCPIGLVSRYADLLTDALNIPEDRPPVLALSLGWAETETPINQARTSRAPLEEVLRFY